MAEKDFTGTAVIVNTVRILREGGKQKNKKENYLEKGFLSSRQGKDSPCRNCFAEESVWKGSIRRGHDPGWILEGTNLREVVVFRLTFPCV